MFFVLEYLGPGFFPNGKSSKNNIFVRGDQIDIIPNGYDKIKKAWECGFVVI